MPMKEKIISMEDGQRTLNIASLNPDSMKEEQTQREVINGLIRSAIRISEIHETHITQDRSYLLGNYRIVTASSDKSATTGVVSGGTSIIIQESTQHHITQIKRQSIRVLRSTMGRAKSKMPIRIISTYAPHNGYAEEEERERERDDTGRKQKAIMNKTCARHRIIWCADANGQIGRKNDKENIEQAAQEHDAEKIIGLYTKAEITEKENGMQLRRECQQRQTIPMATWKMPKIAKQDKWKQQKPMKIWREKDGSEKYMTNMLQRGPSLIEI